MAQREARIIIHNRSGYLRLVKTFDHLCGGQWTPDWEPPGTIEPGADGTKWSESDGVWTGTEGYVKYDLVGPDKRHGMLYIYWDNPFYGRTTSKYITHVDDWLPDCDFEKPTDNSTFSVDTSLDFSLALTAFTHIEGGGNITSPGDLAAAVAPFYAGGPVLGVITGIVELA